MDVISCCFLEGFTESPRLAVLYQDAKEQRHISLCDVSLADKDMTDFASPMNRKVEAGASMLIPVPVAAG
jgi:hypothetical protein